MERKADVRPRTGNEVETMEHLSEMVNADDNEHSERSKFTKSGFRSCLTEAPRDNIPFQIPKASLR